MRWDTRTDGRSQAFVEPARKAIALRPDDPRGWEQLAQFLTGAGAVDGKPGNRRQQKAEIDNDIVLEKDRADNGQIGQYGNIKVWQTGRLLHFHQRCAQHCAHPGAQKGQGQPADDLIGAQGDGDKGMKQRQPRPHQRCRCQPQPGVVALVGDAVGCHRAHEHHPLHAQI